MPDSLLSGRGIPFTAAFRRQASRLAQSLGDNPLQLAVDAAKLVGSPRLQRIHGLAINAQNEILGRCLFRSQNPLVGLMVQRTRINHRLC